MKQLMETIGKIYACKTYAIKLTTATTIVQYLC